jgi:pilus assembly protein CpaB
MNRSKLVFTFVLALLIAAAASFFVMNKLKQTGVKASASTYRLVMASKNLDVGTKLTEADLRLADWSAGSPPPGSFTKVSDAVGRAVLYPTFQDELILEAKLAPVGSGAGLPAVIPEGMRAVSIRVDEVVAVAGFVGPGTRVDVLLTGNPNRAGSDSLTETILQDVQVLAAGEKIQPDAQGRAERVNVVTLLCSPEDAAKLTLAASEGHIQLVLRNPADKAKSEKAVGVARHALYSGAPAPAPVKVARVVRRAPAAPSAPPPPVVEPPKPVVSVIEMVRGEKISRVEFGSIPSEAGTNPR